MYNESSAVHRVYRDRIYLNRFGRFLFVNNYFVLNMKKIFTLFLIVLFGISGGLGGYFVEAATTSMDLTVSAGSLGLTSSASATLTGVSVSFSAATTTGSVANVSVTDERGTGAGWSAVMTSEHFTATGTTRTLAGSNNTVSFTGDYDGLDGIMDPNGNFNVKITGGGAVGVAIFQWTDPAGNTETGSTTASSVSLSNGISVQFDTATYAVDDEWSANVDVFPYTGLLVTPGSITAASGSTTQVTAGSAEYLSGSGSTSNSKTLMTAAVNYGFGDYDQAESLSLQVHANSLSGSFTSDATITVS